MSDETTVRFFEPSEEAVSAFQQAFRGNTWWKRLWYWLVRGRIATREWVSIELCSALERALFTHCQLLWCDRPIEKQVLATLSVDDEHEESFPLVEFSIPIDQQFRLVKLVLARLPGPGVSAIDGRQIAKQLVEQLYKSTASTSDEGIRIDGGAVWSDGATLVVYYRADDFLD